MNEETEKQENRAPSLAPPSLSPELNGLYQSLNLDNKMIFLRVFRFIWGVVAPVSRFVKYGGVLYSYYAVDFLRVRYGLTSSQLSLLSFLYHVTGKGQQITDSWRVYNAFILPELTRDAKKSVLRSLKLRGYVSRSTRNTSLPYLSRSYSRHPVFINLTSSGVRLIETFEKDLYKILVNSSFEDLAGTKKRPRKNSRPQ